MTTINVKPFYQHPGLMLLAGCVMLLAAGGAKSQPAAPGNAPPAVTKVGGTAPDFTLQDFKGGRFTLSSSMKENTVVLWFTNLCEGCQSVIPDVKLLKSEYEKKGVEFVAVSVLGKDRETVENVMKKNGVNFRFLYDPDGKATASYAGRFVEATCPLKNIYVIKKGGTIAFMSHLPGVDGRELVSQIDKTLAAKAK
jgi:peroxiredoxin